MNILFALIAGAGVFLVFYSLVRARAVHPVQARLTQLGSMQARTLEELELQQPFFERTIRPLAIRLSGIGLRFTSTKKQGRTEQRLAKAGKPRKFQSRDHHA